MAFVACQSPAVEVHRKAPIAPPGTQWLRDSLYLDKTEVTVFAWGRYMTWIAQTFGDKSLEYERAQPNEKVWRYYFESESSAMSFGYRYLYDPQYAEFPIVGISHQQAQNYCAWRTAITLLNFERQYNPLGAATRYEIQLYYRLPTFEEWRYAVRQTSKAPMSYRHWADATQRVANIPDSLNHPIIPPFTWDSFDGQANIHGFRHLIGNVAEMLADTLGLAGGSWQHPIKDALPDLLLPYEGQRAWSGFRCLCVYDKSNFFAHPAWN